MLVVIAIIGILAALLLPAIARSKQKALQTVCRGNLKQLALGFSMYVGDFQEQLPAPGSKSKYGPHEEDWIWWQHGRGITNSTIARYVSGFQAKLFTCPMDMEARQLQTEGFLEDEPYRYSYALTSYDLTNKFNPGMATIITLKKEVFPFRMSQVKNPSAKIMLAEEDRETIDDPRFVPLGKKQNLISPRHGQKGNVVFADMHIETVTPEFGQNATNSQPAL